MLKNYWYKALSILLITVIASCSENAERDSFFIKGKEKIYQKDYNSALKFFSESIKLDSNFYDAYVNQGVCYYQLGNVSQSVACYQRAILLKPDHYDANFNLSNSYYTLENYDSAILALQQLMNYYPDSASPYLSAGTIYQTESKFEQAKEMYQKALEKGSPRDVAFANLAAVHYELKKYQDAKKYAKLALAANENRSEALNVLGMIYFLEEDYSGAMTYYNAAIVLLPSQAYYRYNRGEALKAVKKYDDAISDFKIAVYYNEKHLKGWASLGETYFMNNNFQESVKAYQHIENDIQEDHINNFIYAYALMKTGAKDQACKRLGGVTIDKHNINQISKLKFDELSNFCKN